MEYQIIVSGAAASLGVAGYLPYIRDILKRKITPHAFTWIIWTLAVGISSALQISGGAGIGSLTTILVTCILLFISALSIKFGSRDITRADIIFFVFSLLALALWIFVRAPIWSAVLIVAADALAFFPTIRKSWNKPFSETLSSYVMNGLAYGLSIFALQQINILTLLYPVFWVVADTMFSILLVLRRKVVVKNKRE